MKKLSRLFNSIAIALALNLGAGVPESSANRGFLPASPPASIGCMAHTFNDSNGKIIKDDPRFFIDVIDCVSIAKQINRASGEIPAITITKIGSGSAERPSVVTLGIMRDDPAIDASKPAYCVTYHQPDPNDPNAKQILSIDRLANESLLSLLRSFKINGTPQKGEIQVDCINLQLKVLDPKPSIKPKPYVY